MRRFYYSDRPKCNLPLGTFAQSKIGYNVQGSVDIEKLARQRLHLGSGINDDISRMKMKVNLLAKESRNEGNNVAR